MRTLQRIASACLCIPLALALVPAMAFAAPEGADAANEAGEGEATALQTQTVVACPPGYHKWVHSDDSPFMLRCRKCNQSINTRVELTFSGTWKASTLSAIIQNKVEAYEQENSGEGLVATTALILGDDATIDMDANLTVDQISQQFETGDRAYSLTVTGSNDYTLSVEQYGIRVYGDFTMTGGTVKTGTVNNDTALLSEGTVTLEGGVLEAKHGTNGIYATSGLIVKDPARVTATSNMTPSYAVAVYSEGDITVEGGNISARGAHAIYTEKNLYVQGGTISASTASETVPAVYAKGQIVKVDTVTIDEPIFGTIIGLDGGMIALSGSSSNEVGSSIGTVNGSGAPVVALRDGITRDAAFYENFGKESDSADGTGDGANDGKAGGSGTTDGTGTTDGMGSGTTGGNGADGKADGATDGKSDGKSGTEGTDSSSAGGTTDGTGATGGTADGSKTDESSSASTEGSSTPGASAISSVTGEDDVAGASYQTTKLRMKSVSKNSIKLTWAKVSGAAYYIVCGTSCGKNKRYQILDDVTSTSYTDSGLKANTYYRYYVVAFSEKNQILSKSKSVHIATSGGTYTNAKSVTIPAGSKKISLEKGATRAIKATYVKASASLKAKDHVKMRYESSNKAVATVSSNGKITAKKAGTCTIYAYAQNGVYATAKVTVA